MQLLYLLQPTYLFLKRAFLCFKLLDLKLELLPWVVLLLPPGGGRG